jgi:hypothetical protein
MTKMYVANCSRQEHDFYYNLPESPRSYIQHISQGGQIPIGMELNPAQVEAIILQHEKYGFMPWDRVHTSKQYCRLIYSLDRSVPLSAIHEMIGRNDSALGEIGREARKQAAVALNNQLEAAVVEQRLPGGLEEVDFSVVEEKPVRVVGERATEIERSFSEIPPVAEGIKVRRTEAPEPAETESRRGRGRRGRPA